MNKLLQRTDAQLLLTTIAVGLAALALFVAARADRQVTIKNDVSETEASVILERANDTVNFADSILSFLEGASVVVGAMLAVGAWMLRNNIQKQIEETSDFVQRTEQRFIAREKQLDEEKAIFSKRLDEMVEETRGTIAAVEQEARNSMRVLSMLVLAEQQVRAHNFDTAIRTLQNAYALDPHNQVTNYLLGYLYIVHKDYNSAIQRLEDAIRQEADFAPAIAALGLALRRKGDTLQPPEQKLLWSQAETKLLEALDSDERLTDAEGQSYYGTLGGLYRRQQRYKDAIEAYEHARKVTPNSSYPVSNLATLYTHEGNETKAHEYYQRVLRAAELQLDDDPRDVWTRADYAQAKLVLGDRDEARNQLTMVLEHARKERGVLDTVLSGLRFLNESPIPISGIEDMIELLEKAIAKLDDTKP